MDNAIIQSFADVLESELDKQKSLFINDELSVRRMRDNSDDRALILKWLTDPNGVITVAWKEGIPWGAQKIEEAFFADIADERLIPCIIEQDSSEIGYIQFYPLDKESYRFTEQITFEPLSGGYGVDLFIAYSELWGKGIGTRIIKAMADFLIHTLGATIVCADPGEENRRSVACWLKAGFVPIGKVADYDESDKQCILMAYSDDQKLMDKRRAAE